ncbi:MAG: hypothetical protein NVSMB29_03530 [Candidatus Dormibacteria bacterium]
MPTYGYRCQSCASEFEVWQRMTDQPGADCPSCGAAGKRLFFPTGIVFKGGGFYKTDSRGAEGSGATAKAGGDAPGTKEAGKPTAPAAADTAAKPAPAPSSDSAPSAPAAGSKPASSTPSAPSGGSPPGKSA